MKDLVDITRAVFEAGQEKMSELFGDTLGTYKLYSTEASCRGEYYSLEIRLEYVSEEFKTLCDVVWNVKESKIRIMFCDDNDDMSNEFTLYPNDLEDAKLLITNHRKSWA